MSAGAARHHSRALACEAPAKVNLALHVTGRRDDGYHLLDTVAVFAGVADRLAVAPSAEVRLRVTGPFAQNLQGAGDNLVLRAAEALRRRLPDALSFELEKNLPVAAGIGGGSADAAAALRILTKLCDPPPSGEELREIAVSLGADVPMCLEGVALRARGIGEDTAPLPDFPELPLLLVNPGVAVPTGPVFQALGGRYGPALPDPEGLAGLEAVVEWLVATGNDLEVPALEVAPEVGVALAELRGLPTCRFARMSGSGATCFGVFSDSNEAAEASSLLRARRPAWWIEPTLTRSAPPEIVRTGG